VDELNRPNVEVLRSKTRNEAIHSDASVDDTSVLHFNIDNNQSSLAAAPLPYSFELHSDDTDDDMQRFPIDQPASMHPDISDKTLIENNGTSSLQNMNLTNKQEQLDLDKNHQMGNDPLEMNMTSEDAISANENEGEVEVDEGEEYYRNQRYRHKKRRELKARHLRGKLPASFLKINRNILEEEIQSESKRTAQRKVPKFRVMDEV
jgi:hypothetical protein